MTEVQQEEIESKFIKLLKRSRTKIGSMKHIDGKALAENYFFPLFAALYEEIDSELDNVYDSINSEPMEDIISEALADSPQFIQSMGRYVITAGQTIETLFHMAGWLAINEEGQTGFTEKATDEAKALYSQISEETNAALNALKEFEETYAAAASEYDDDDDDDEEVAETSSESEVQPETGNNTPPPGETEEEEPTGEGEVVSAESVEVDAQPVGDE